MGSLLERIAYIAEIEGISIGKLERTIGASKGVISRAIQNKTDIQAKWITAIVENYQRFSPTWLISGKGSILNGASPLDIYNRIFQIIENEGISVLELENKLGLISGTFYNAILNPDSVIAEKWVVKINTTFPQYSKEWIRNGSTVSETNTVQEFTLRTDRHIESQNIPLYNFDAAAGLVAIFNQHQVEPTDYIRIPDIPPVDGAIYIKGESMSPLIKNGDVVMFKKKEVNIDNILWGEIYILSFMNDGDSYTAVKYLRQSDRPDYIRLESFNPDFPPKDIPMSSITALAIVKASLTFHTME